MSRKLFIIILASVTVMLTLASFIAMKSLGVTTIGSSQSDKAEIIYERASVSFEKGDTDKGLSDLVTILSVFKNSPYAEKALRDLASHYLQKGEYEKSNYYNKRLLKEFSDIQDAKEVRGKIDNYSIKKLVDPLRKEDSLEYVVQSGDSL